MFIHKIPSCISQYLLSYFGIMYVQLLNSITEFYIGRQKQIIHKCIIVKLEI